MVFSTRSLWERYGYLAAVLNRRLVFGRRRIGVSVFSVESLLLRILKFI